MGIAGANHGLTSCYQTGGTTPTCAATNGLYPGYWNGVGRVGPSPYLNDLSCQQQLRGRLPLLHLVHGG